MPGYERAELSAELKVVPHPDTDGQPADPSEAAKRGAGESGLGREAGPETTMISGRRREVLEAMTQVIEAALDAGARTVEVRIEAEGDAPRFGGG
ncbi:MAG: hypothetical protein ACR2JR_10130 [Rubrobacteraceae bacterium]